MGKDSTGTFPFRLSFFFWRKVRSHEPSHANSPFIANPDGCHIVVCGIEHKVLRSRPAKSAGRPPRSYSAVCLGHSDSHTNCDGAPVLTTCDSAVVGQGFSCVWSHRHSLFGIFILSVTQSRE